MTEQIYLLKFSKSTKQDKKYMVVLQQGDTIRTIHFGANGMSDYTIHKDDDRKERYIKRHQKNEDFNDPFTAGFWSRWILWNKKTLKESLVDTLKKFNIKIKKE